VLSRAYSFGNGRFELVRGLGEGGYGAVFEAYDRELQMGVALKQLSRVGPDALLRFKREFRVLADLRHEHVVRLYELFEDEGAWFFTMELLEGESFTQYVRPGNASRGFDEQRVRDATWALAKALSAVHRAVALHSPVPTAFALPLGRETQLARLTVGLEGVRLGHTKLCIIEGDSGLGKSTLMHHFAMESRDSDPTLRLLRGACYERETVPFKAFDGIVDGLAMALAEMDPSDYGDFVPAQGNLLVRAFPVLERLPLIASSGGRIPAEPNAQRRLVFDGLLSLLRGLSRSTPLLVCIEDLQWADTDSLALLQALLTADEPPRCLFLATARPLERFERTLGPTLRAILSAACTERLPLPPIGLEVARDLTRRMATGRLDEGSIEVVARESEGHPMFLAELVRVAIEQGATQEKGATLERAILRRAGRLSLSGRTLLQLLAVASTPLPRALLRDALGLSGEELLRGLSELSDAHLVRAFGQGAVECYHARIREAVSAALDPQSRAQDHGRLARALEVTSPDSPARIGSHWLGAGEPRRAIPWLERAALAADDMYAFDQTAALYTELLQLSEHADRDRVQGWRVAQGNALMNAGRSAEAARAYLSALDDENAQQAAILRRLSSQALLQAGEVELGLSEMRTLFRETNLVFAETTTRALLSLGAQKISLQFVDFWVEPLPDSRISAHKRAALDHLFALAPALGWVDMVRGVDLSARHLRLSLKTRDIRHMSLALAYESSMSEAAQGGSAHSDRCLARARELAARVGDPYLEAVCDANAGLVAFFRVQLETARALLTAAERGYREDCVGASWSLGVARTNLLTTLILLGESRTHETLSRQWLQEAKDRGDRLGYTSLVVLGAAYQWELNHGDIEGAERSVDACMAGWPAQPFSSQHLGHIISKVNIKRMQGGAAAHEYIEQRWNEVARSLLGRSDFVRGSLLPIRAHCALDAALATSGEAQKSLVAHADQQVKQLSKLRTPSARVRELLLVAQVQAMREQHDAAVHTLRSLLGSPEVAVLALERAGAMNLLGKMLGGEEGKALVHEAEAWASARGFRDPQFALRVVTPLSRIYSV